MPVALMDGYQDKGFLRGWAPRYIPRPRIKMRNPFMTRNPFMSAWLSSANKVLGAARGQSAAAAKRHVTSIQAEAARQVLDFWGGKVAAPAKRKSRTRR